MSEAPRILRVAKLAAEWFLVENAPADAASVEAAVNALHARIEALERWRDGHDSEVFPASAARTFLRIAREKVEEKP